VFLVKIFGLRNHPLNLNQIMLAEEVGDEKPELFPLFDKHFTAAQTF